MQRLLDLLDVYWEMSGIEKEIKDLNKKIAVLEKEKKDIEYRNRNISEEDKSLMECLRLIRIKIDTGHMREKIEKYKPLQESLDRQLKKILDSFESTEEANEMNEAVKRFNKILNSPPLPAPTLKYWNIENPEKKKLPIAKFDKHKNVSQYKRGIIKSQINKKQVIPVTDLREWRKKS